MDTNLLSEYQFAVILTEWAHTSKLDRLRAEGRDDDLEAKRGAPTEEDLRDAFRRLEARRVVAAQILREGGHAPQ